jgi:hypothetical protein
MFPNAVDKLLELCANEHFAMLCADRWGSLGRSEAQFWEASLWGDAELNPGFTEPFDPETVTVASYNGWYTGKVCSERPFFLLFFCCNDTVLDASLSNTISVIIF